VSAPAASAGSDDDRMARVALSRLVEPGDHRVVSLVAELGAVKLRELLSQDPESSGLRTDVHARLPTLDPERDLDLATRQGIRFVTPGDDEWPSRLDDLMRAEILQERVGPPLGLWVKGPLRLDQLAESVAVVGSRSSTTYGDDVAAAISAVVASSGRPVVSGAAFGIDVAAHRGALSMEGPTVAILACGADRDYPMAHQALLRHLAKTCAVISELPPGCAPTRGRFLSRNRLIAALTRGTVVVEAAVRSGALNTANWAGRLNRPLMGVPGPVTSGPSQGVHQLVRSGAATLVTNGAEVLEVVGDSGSHLVEAPHAPARPRDRLSRRLAQVLDAVPVASPAPVDSIASAAGIGLVEVSSALTNLHRNGLVERSQSGWRLAPAAQL
jgi:DNA processing protein